MERGCNVRSAVFTYLAYELSINIQRKFKHYWTLSELSSCQPLLGLRKSEGHWGTRFHWWLSYCQLRKYVIISAAVFDSAWPHVQVGLGASFVISITGS
jgi:hypothetical protein